MTPARLTPLTSRLPADPDPDVTYQAFTQWAADRGFDLYPAQQEALIELVSDSHVILSTPTGSGKSLVAMGAHFSALSHDRRSFYTAPLKALVSEKFFALVEAFGPENVGMMTGDSAVNANAPIICCTAEILANLALREGASANVDQVVMDEFHFYADPQRGWAWQVPLLELVDVQFLLMSATLGDVRFFADDLRRRTAREVAVVTSVERPVPLTYSYVTEPIHELLEELLSTHRAPVYVVHFTQAGAIERAQSLTSVNVASRAERDQIAAEIGSFRFAPGFGKVLSRLVRHGIGVHHAGMLPKYRRLVERLTQAGLLKVVCGTDTLGVGINVPIRTVVQSGLTKYDGVRTRHLSAREFHQIAGRAGRAGYDTVGEVIALAPEHVIENERAITKAGDDPKKRRKIVRKKPPEGFVSWSDKTFERLVNAAPEPLTSSFTVSHAMVLGVISRPGDAFAAMRRLLDDNHEPSSRRLQHVRRAIAIYRALLAANVVEPLDPPDAEGRTVRLTVDLPENFALNQPLSPFALAAFELLDPASPTYALDMVSIVEATLDNPRQVLSAQQFEARGEAVNAMKAEGLEYDERMELLEDVTYPQPLAELLETAFEIYRKSHPWVADYELSPKAVVRDLYEQAMTFGEFVAHYRLARSEGLVLRYLADAYRTLRQTIPPDATSEELDDLISWLGELVRQTDSSLLDEWEQLRDPTAGEADELGAVRPPSSGAEPAGVTSNPRAFRVLVRNAMFRRVELVARRQWDELGELDADSGWDADAWADALEPYFEAHADIGIDANARSSDLVVISEDAGGDDGPPPDSGQSGSAELGELAGAVGELSDPGRMWLVRQILDDPSGDHDWSITAEADLAASDEAGYAVVRITSVSVS
jgi:superfamily II RNA helicase